MSQLSLSLPLMTRTVLLLTCLSGLVRMKDQVHAGLVRYAIVFDVGASKTEMEIYKINVHARPVDVADIKQLDPSPNKVKPGIADLAGNSLSAIEDYLTPLLDSAKKTVPRQKHKATPVYFLATGGMRRLREDLADSTLDKVKKIFNDKKKCPFKFNSKDAKIMSGAYEGIYGWITVNFLMGIFRPGNSHPSYGILDLGGSALENALEDVGNVTLSVTLGDTKHRLFSRSYLGYGLDQAYKRYLTIEILSQQSLTTGVVKSPCHNKGFQQPLPIKDKNINITLEGTASVATCRSVIQKDFFCKTRECPFFDQPSLHGDFFGFAGIFYTALDVGLLDSDDVKPLSAAMFEKSSQDVCTKNYADVKKNAYSKFYCFRTSFIYELLTKGYGLPADKLIQVGNKLEGFHLGWALGAMLYNTGFL